MTWRPHDLLNHHGRRESEYERLCGQATEAMQRAEKAVGTHAVRDEMLRLAGHIESTWAAGRDRISTVWLRQLITRMDQLTEQAGGRP